MAWRIVRQPNGKLARFSDIVDDFTEMDMTRAEALDLCRIYNMGIKESRRKVQAGVEDWKPWTVGVRGDGTDRWEDCLRTITIVHGENVAQERRIMGTTPQR